MREYAWYCPEYNWIVFQFICDGCYIAFEWEWLDIHEATDLFGLDKEPMHETTWIPLGEV